MAISRRALLVLPSLALLPLPAVAEDQAFRINNMVEPESLDPGLVIGVPEHRILSNLFPLCQYE